MSKNQFTGTATQPQHNRKLCQFNKDSTVPLTPDRNINLLRKMLSASELMPVKYALGTTLSQYICNVKR